MSDRAKCLENARKVDPNATLCSEELCSSVGGLVYAFCSCKPPYPPQNPCPYGPDAPVAVYNGTGSICFCCCGQASATVDVDSGEARDVGDVWVGHMVKVARRPAG